MLAFLKKEMIPEAIQELENRRQTVFNAFNNFTPILARPFEHYAHPER